jgi:hypothetical protein
MKLDIPDRVWICPYHWEGLPPRQRITAYRDPEMACPAATRHECATHRETRCPGPAAIPPVSEDARDPVTTQKERVSDSTRSHP